MLKKYKPALRKCVSTRKLKDSSLFVKTSNMFFTFPHTTYWTSVKWENCVSNLISSFKCAKFKLDADDDAKNEFMTKMCHSENSSWTNVKNNKWQIVCENTDGSIKIRVKSQNDFAEILITPFLDKTFLALEFRRWIGSSITAYKWLKYVYLFSKNFIKLRS